MKKVILVDGNNLMFRSFYATLYSGSIMTNKEGFPTNALYGFVNMMNKIIAEEKPEYIMVAFDIGKTFRHEKYVEMGGPDGGNGGKGADIIFKVDKGLKTLIDLKNVKRHIKNSSFSSNKIKIITIKAP